MISYLNIGYTGRFGNQIFQFAALLGIADKLGLDAKIPKANTEITKSQRLMDGTQFEARFELCDFFEIDSSYFDDNIIVDRTVNEPHFHFDYSMFLISDYTNINGYFQTEKYFEHCKEKIKHNLTIKPEFLKEAKLLLPNTTKELVSIHIRRGDYTYPNDCHPLNGIDYVKSAIKLFPGDNFHFLVISDDKDWCRSAFGGDTRFTILNSNSHHIDFSVMTLCHHHIISNSSFSWWASWLSNNKDKRIIAPKNWFGSGLRHNTSDLYTKKMIIL